MGELVTNLGIDWRLLIAQIVNFFILLFILKKFLYKPLLSVLDKRRTVIEGNLKKERELDTRLVDLDAEHEKMITDSRVKSKALLDDSYKRASATADEIVEQARVEAQAIIEKTEKQLMYRKKQFDAELVSNSGELVALSIEQVLPDVLGKDAHARLVEQSLKKFHGHLAEAA